MDTRDHSGATARMLAKQYGHMKIVGLIDAHSPSLPKSLYRSPGTCICGQASAGVPSSPLAPGASPGPGLRGEGVECRAGLPG